MAHISTKREVLVSSADPDQGLPDTFVYRPSEEALSRRDAALDRFIGMVSTGVLRVGERLSEQVVADRLGMSRTPLREALAVLSSEGMVRQIPQIGFEVLTVHDEDIAELIAMRREIEGLIVERLAKSHTDEQLDQLRGIENRLQRERDAAMFGSIDTEFHAAMATMAGYTSGARTLISWRNRMRVFRARLPLRATQMKEIVEEHLNILVAIEDGSQDRASEAIGQHMENTKARLLQDVSDGTVTIVFSDIEGSTKSMKELGNEKWMDVLGKYNQIVRRNMKRHGGSVVNTAGDGLVLAFPNADEALQYSIKTQRAFARYNKAAETPVLVRMGLDVSEAVNAGEDSVGRKVISAARIAEQAAGGEILVSSSFTELTGSVGGISFGDEREVELEGLSGLHRVFKVETSQVG